jgi:hypothetical protein
LEVGRCEDKVPEAVLLVHRRENEAGEAPRLALLGMGFVSGDEVFASPFDEPVRGAALGEELRGFFRTSGFVQRAQIAGQVAPEVVGFLFVNGQVEDAEVMAVLSVEGAVPYAVLIAALLLRFGWLSDG